MALPGKNAKVKIGVNDVKGLNEATFTANGENIEVSTFDSDGWRERMQGLKDFTMSLTGYYDPTDTNGQVAIRTAWLNGDDVTVDYLVDGTNGFSGAYKVASCEITAAAAGEVAVTFELESNGALTILP